MDLSARQLARFWASVEHTDTCWLWAQRTRRGYGEFQANGARVSAHRLSYELLVGPIPAGLHLDHLCRVRHCVNPDHLEPVTVTENNRRAWLAKSPDDTCRHGHPLAGDNVYLYRGRRHCRTCKRETMRRLRAA